MPSVAQADKTLLPNQHLPLHALYGQRECCLCGADARIATLERRISELERARPGPGQQCPTCGHRQPMTASQRTKAWRERRGRA